eukprot:817505-Rhodomonas_salina.1
MQTALALEDSTRRSSRSKRCCCLPAVSPATRSRREKARTPGSGLTTPRARFLASFSNRSRPRKADRKSRQAPTKCTRPKPSQSNSAPSWSGMRAAFRPAVPARSSETR